MCGVWEGGADGRFGLSVSRRYFVGIASVRFWPRRAARKTGGQGAEDRGVRQRRETGAQDRGPKTGATDAGLRRGPETRARRRRAKKAGARLAL
ncbi:hypothetical protein NBRC116596_18950 [Litorivita sp. NS0012-18]